MKYKDLNNEEKNKFWKEHVQKWQKSGLSQGTYCKENNIVSKTFSTWKKKLTAKESSFVKIPSEIFLNNENDNNFIEIIKGPIKIRLRC